MTGMSKMSAVALAATGLVAGVNFVAPSSGSVPQSVQTTALSPEMAPMSSESSTGAYGAALVATAAVGVMAAGAQRTRKVARKATHGIKFSYSVQKDAYADLEFMNDVGYLPDGTPMNRAGNAINHPETIGPDPHTPGSPLPRAEFVNSVGYLPDGTPLNAAGNALNHPETMGPDSHAPGSPLPESFYAAATGYLVDGTPMASAGNLSVQAPPPAAAPSMPAAAPATPPPAAAPTSVAAAFTSTAQDTLHGISFSYSMQRDAYADLEFLNDVGYLPDGTPMNRAGNAINHPETIGPDPHTPGSPLPRAEFVNSVGYLPDGTPLNAAGNALNHPETMGPDSHAPGSPLPPSFYAAAAGYLVDGTDMMWAGNLSVKEGAPVPAMAAQAAPAAAPTPVAAAFVGASAPTSGTTLRHAPGFAYAVQKDAYVDLTFGNDVGYLPDGTPMNRAGNAINHPESIGPDPHAPGSPLPRALFVNDVGYLPDGTPMNRAGNAINHPESIGPDPHAPGSELPPSAYAADIGYLVDGTPLDAAGNNAVH